MIPGTSCLATIVLSLRDKSHPPIEASHNYLLFVLGRFPAERTKLPPLAFPSSFSPMFILAIGPNPQPTNYKDDDDKDDCKDEED